MTLSELVKKVKSAAKQRLLTLKSVIKGRGFEKFKRKYFFSEVIGNGGFGVVYSGFNASTYQAVAIKFVERRQIIEWGKLEEERVPMEIAMLSRCQKISGVIDLVEYVSVPDGFLIVMDRPMVCIDLYNFITENGRLNEQISCFLFRQIIETTQEIMQICKVIHRDIKNENVVIDLVTGQTKLIDFGAATYLKSTKYHGFQGTKLYCPPEWFIHSVYLSFEATIWSLGVILYSMLNGQLPFMNEKDICTKQMMGPLPKFAEYSEEADDLIQRCLAYEPFRRIKLERLKRHKWFTAKKATTSWSTMLNELLQQNQSSSIAKALNNELRKESGVNTSIQIDEPVQKRQNASITNDSDLRQNKTMAVPSNKPSSSSKHQATTCVIDINGKRRVERGIRRSKTTRVIPAKLKQRACSNDSGTASCSQSPIISPVFQSETNKFLL